MEEIVTIVDRRNRVIGSAPRSQMRADGLCHRATYILVFDRDGRLFVHKRTPTKDIYPGYLDIAVGGVVMDGETYDQSAGRELEEELGIKATHLEPRFDFYYHHENNRVWGRVYRCIWNGPIVLQKEEIESGDFYRVQEIMAMRSHKYFTPDGMVVLQRFLEMENGRKHTSLQKHSG